MKEVYQLNVSPEYAIVTYFPRSLSAACVTMDEWTNRADEFIAAMNQRKGFAYRTETHVIGTRKLVEHTWEKM